MLDISGMPENVADAFSAFGDTDARVLLETRALILDEATRLGVGPVSETLKWGQPSYLVRKGTTLRLGLVGGKPAVFVHCQTSIIQQARELFGDAATFSDNRAILINDDTRAVTHVVCAALTYHQRSR